MTAVQDRGRPDAADAGVGRWQGAGWESFADELAVEEPLQLLLDGAPLSVLMRTPGHDLELAIGLLWAEGVLRDRAQLVEVRISAESGEREAGLPPGPDLLESNQVDLRLGAGSGSRLERSFLQSSACGVCGATTLESLALDFPILPAGPVLPPGLLPRMSERLAREQRLFKRTGGLHAAALFSSAGELVCLREDVGRHNCVDKVVGRALLDGLLPAHGHVLLVSGRGGYEIVQKAVAAGIPIVAAVGAPSSLAVATARRFNLTLVGFLRGERFNVYSSPERLQA
jgi:FdhD protein